MIENDWTFSDTVCNIKTLKTYYNGILTSFSVLERKKRIALCRQFKDKVYALHFDEYKRNLIWRYINDEIDYKELLLLGGLENGFNNKRNG